MIAVPTDAGRAGERSIAILFVDIRGFMPLFERHSAGTILEMLNRYYEVIGTAVLEHEGSIDKYIGDTLMATFGSEGGDAGAICSAALNAARAMTLRIEPFNAELEKEYGERFSIGMGIHYGDVVVGALGHSEYRQQTVIGDAVNRAALIEAFGKALGEIILVSETFKELVGVGTWSAHRTVLQGTRGESILYAPRFED